MDDDFCFELGYIRNAAPYPLCHIAVTADFSVKGTETIPARVVLPPGATETYDPRSRSCGTAFLLPASYPDFLRVYAQIAVNCLAALKRPAIVPSAELGGIKQAS